MLDKKQILVNVYAYWVQQVNILKKKIEGIAKTIPHEPWIAGKLFKYLHNNENKLRKAQEEIEKIVKQLGFRPRLKGVN